MKKQNTLLMSALFVAVSAFASTTQAAWKPEVVPADYGTAYIPDGFDTNDNAQLVGEGLFLNTCFKPASVKHEVNTITHEITIAPEAYYYEGFCLQVLVPYDQTVDFGMLEPGTYRIKQRAQGGNKSVSSDLGELKVRAATTSNADDFLYAPVSQAFFDDKDGKQSVKISGTFSNSCMTLVDVMVSVQPKVLVIQPISELKNNGHCVAGDFPYEKTVALSKVAAGRYLLHVRSLNAKAINTLVDVK